MAKLWKGRFEKETAGIADDFNSSISFDSRMYREDILGSLAHAAMLAERGIIKRSDYDAITKTLTEILSELESGELKFDPAAEDIHSFVEGVLTERCGEAGKVLHTARSRNDQVALDFRMYVINESEKIKASLKKLVAVIADKAEENVYSVAPGYTHLQRAQPISFGHHLAAYAFMFLRDIERLDDCIKRTKVSPLGSCALAGTTYDTDRFMTAEALGFDRPCENSIDGVSDRDFALESAFCCSAIMMHLSRFSEEMIMWASYEFKYVELDDSYSTGSSIMPQKKNPDMAELARGKTGRVYGNLISLLTVMKGLPLAYNKDMQEDKESLFDSMDTVKNCLDVFSGMLETSKFNKENMKAAAAGGYINATDAADYLVSKGLEFRNAYRVVGQLVAYCIKTGKNFETLTVEEYRMFSPLFDDGVYEAIDLENCVKRRTSYGGTGFESVKHQIVLIREAVER